MKALELALFPNLAERVNALYNEDQDALLLAMLGQEYIVRHDGVFLHGQKAPDNHVAVILDYLFSSGTNLELMPWRTIVDFQGKPCPEFRQKAELPVTQYASDIIARAGSLLPMFDGKAVPSLIGSDIAITVRALPKVYLHMELSQENQDFPSEAWILFSNNAVDFISISNMQTLAELLKDRILSLLRIY